jgi:type IV secretory pathway VirB2 component (pilin)
MKRIIERILFAATTAVLAIALSGTSWALSSANGLMPWDGPLQTIVTFLIDTAAPAVVVLAFIGAASCSP